MGAGAAGLTAAVRAAHAGCRVLVLEAADETLATFRGNTSRLLHPNLYAWPRPEWSDPDAGLPILTWSAGTAASVASTIDRRFRAEVSRTGLIDCRTSAKLVWSWPPRMAGALLELQYTERDEPAPRSAAVSAIILAVGFGREPRTAPNSPFPGYWDHDLLASTHGAKECLILGAGDGGLTDALRVRIGDFDQGRTFAALLDAPEASGLAKEIEALEALPAADMDAAYRELSTAWLDTAIRQHGLRPTQVTLADSGLAFSTGRFPLNKLLVSRLWRMKELRIVQRRVDVPVRGPDGRFGPVELAPGATESFDLVLIRFGKGDAIGQFGTDIRAGCLRMVERCADPALNNVPDDPPAGAALAALADALAGCARLRDAVEVVLLYLRHAAAPSERLAAAPAFERLCDEIVRRLEVHQHAAVGHAPGVLESVRAWLLEPRPEDIGVVVRALAEALDFFYGDRLRRRPASTSELARLLSRDESQISRALLRLRELDLVDPPQPDAADRRRTEHRLSLAAKQALGRLDRRARKAPVWHLSAWGALEDRAVPVGDEEPAPAAPAPDDLTSVGHRVVPTLQVRAVPRRPSVLPPDAGLFAEGSEPKVAPRPWQARESFQVAATRRGAIPSPQASAEQRPKRKGPPPLPPSVARRSLSKKDR